VAIDQLLEQEATEPDPVDELEAARREREA
jgi:hypothetical protein